MTKEAHAFGDAGYRGGDKREEAQGPCWHVAMQPGLRRKLDLTRPWARLLDQIEQIKASVRAKVEHPFHAVKNLFRHRKARYKGLAKNEAQLFSLFGLANLAIACGFVGASGSASAGGPNRHSRERMCNR